MENVIYVIASIIIILLLTLLRLSQNKVEGLKKREYYYLQKQVIWKVK